MTAMALHTALRPWKRFREREYSKLGALATLLISVVLVFVGLRWVSGDLPASVLAALGFAGNDIRLSHLLANVSSTAVHALLWRDTIFAALYTVGLVLINRPMDGFQIRRLARLRFVATAAALTAGVANLGENAVLLNGLRASQSGGVRYQGRVVADAVLTLCTLKWLGLIVAAVVTLCRLWSAYLHRTQPMQAVTQSPLQMAEPDDYGICCSGGGIRAASYTLGALEVLEAAGLMEGARFISAVSGGNYAATGWFLTREQWPDAPSACALMRSQLTESIDPVSAGIARAVPARADDLAMIDPERNRKASGRQRYLKNGPGGLPRALALALLVIIAHIVVVLTFVFIVSWPLGALLGSFVSHPEFRQNASIRSISIEPRHWLASLVFAAIAAALVIVSVFKRHFSDRWLRFAKVSLAAAIVVALIQIVGPWLMKTVGGLLQGGMNTALAVGGISVSALLGAILRLVRGRLTKALPYLGGVILALVLVLVSGRIAAGAAIDVGRLNAGEPWVWLGVTAGFVALGATVDTQRVSLREVYSTRLQRSFVVSCDAATAPGDSGERSFATLPDKPELIVCCAAQRVGLSPNGIAASSFTVSKKFVTQGRTVLPTEKYMQCLPKRLAKMKQPGTWMATSGAAIASAMGRSSLGTTNAVIAAFGVDLGVWAPSPIWAQQSLQKFPKVRLGYLAKGIFGVYDDLDDYVYVSDGGHWENLGLVELLRRRCMTIVCIDASGDQPSSFDTLTEALALAQTDLDDIDEFDTSALDVAANARGALPPTSVFEIGVKYKASGSLPAADGRILYANLRIAADQPLNVRRFSRSDPKFPHYSTGDQFLDDQQFAFLIAAGKDAGAKLAVRLNALLVSQ